MHRAEVEIMKFNGGEINVTVPYDFVDAYTHIRIVSLLTSSDDVMALLLTVNAIRQIDPTIELSASLPYIPYGRQDRVCNQGEANSIQVMANLINSCNFNDVMIDDPHSDVTGALINNAIIRSQHECFSSKWSVIKRNYLDALICSPDAGSNKKIIDICRKAGVESFIRADKIREVLTGQITETVVYATEEEIRGKNVLIVDDICDGGMTFIKLAEKLKELGANRVGLFVTHGIFSKGTKVLYDVIDDVYTLYNWSDEDYVRNN